MSRRPDSDLFYDKYILWVRNVPKNQVNHWKSFKHIEQIQIYQWKPFYRSWLLYKFVFIQYKVCIATVCIKIVKDMILAILYSCFMAKCNYSLSDFCTLNLYTWPCVFRYILQTSGSSALLFNPIFKDESKVFLKIRRNGLAKFRDPHGGRQGENCDIREDLDCWKMPFPDSFMTINVFEIR